MTCGLRTAEAGFNACDIAKLMGHANISTSPRYVRNLPVGAGEAVMLKNQHRHSNQFPRSQRGFGHFDGSGKWRYEKSEETNSVNAYLLRPGQGCNTCQ